MKGESLELAGYSLIGWVSRILKANLLNGSKVFRIGEQVDKIAGGEVDDPHHGISNPSHEIEKTIQAD